MSKSSSPTRRVRETTSLLLGLASLLGIVMTALGISYSAISYTSSSHRHEYPQRHGCNLAAKVVGIRARIAASGWISPGSASPDVTGQVSVIRTVKCSPGRAAVVQQP